MGQNGVRGSSMRDQVLEQQNIQLHQHASWGLVRNTIVNAKISDALNNIKFTINGSTLRALRCIGEGGYSRVYEVFNDHNEILALKVVNLNDTKVKSELLEEIDFLKQLKNAEKVVDFLEHEVKTDMKSIPFIQEDKDSKNEGDSGFFFESVISYDSTRNILLGLLHNGPEVVQKFDF